MILIPTLLKSAAAGAEVRRLLRSNKLERLKGFWGCAGAAGSGVDEDSGTYAAVVS